MITGQFRNFNEELITVQIQTTGDTITIGEDGVYFAGDPIEIEWEISDLFEIVICKSATINLVTDKWLGEILFSNNARNIPVLIKRGNIVLFDGYLDPNVYNQPFVSDVDSIQLKAIDYLSTLKYYKYKDTTAVNYQEKKQTAKNVKLKDILSEIFGNKIVLYDKSKSISGGVSSNVFDDISLNENLFYGEDADDILTNQDVLECFLRYLNLHVIQQGSNIYIFDWDSIKKTSVQWVNLSTNTTSIISNSTSAITKDIFASNDTNVTIDDVYNQISLECDLQPLETVIESPLSNDNISPLYSGKQKYMTEFISNGNGDSAINAFNQVVKGNNTDYDGLKTVDWFFQVVQNPKWKFNIGNDSTIESIAEKDSDGNYINQYKIPLYLKNNQCKPALIRFGSVTTEGGESKSNKPQSKISMKNYLFISVNGNENNTSGGCSPTQTTLQNSAPLIEYIDNTAGGVFSPADNKTTNYLVFSGKILLQPIAYESSTSKANRNNNYQAIKDGNAPKSESSHPLVPRYYGDVPVIMQNNLVSNDYDNDGRYYTRKFYSTVNVKDAPSSYLNVPSMQPWTANKGEKGYKFEYSAVGDSSDKFSKLPILECELIIGNKRLIETNIDIMGNSTFQWVTVGSEPTIDGQVKTTFSLGVNPDIGEEIIGTEFAIQNTIDYQLNIDVEGTAIPITRADAVNGQVTFRILGLINSLWNDITRRHPSFWRHTQWTEDAKPILAHVENVVIEDFECKLYSDNALNSNEGSDKLIYTSAEQNTYLNVKDNIKFDVITQLTSDECLSKGITTAANLNAAILTSDGLTLHDITNNITNETDVPEKHYINQYYVQYSVPKLILELDAWGEYNFWKNFSWSQFQNKKFSIIGQTQNVKMNITHLKLRQNN